MKYRPSVMFGKCLRLDHLYDPLHDTHAAIRASGSVISYEPKKVRAIVTLADLGLTATEGRKDE